MRRPESAKGIKAYTLDEETCFKVSQIASRAQVLDIEGLPNT